MVDALRAHGLVERTLVSSTFMRCLVAVRALEPRLRLGWSVPRARRDYTASRLWMLPAYAMVARIRRRLPAAAAAHLAAGRCDAVMAHWRLVSAELVRTVGAARRRAVRVDGRRRGADPRARGDGRHGRDHQRSAPVRHARLTLAHLRGGAAGVMKSRGRS